MATDVVAQFTELFTGRLDALGTESGGCWRCEVDQGHYYQHLTGETPIGVYPLRHDSVDGWIVRFGVVDLDIQAPGKHRWDYETQHEAYDAAWNLDRTLKQLNIRAWRERTKSGGMHVWAFAADWVPAQHMRNALLVACQVAGIPPSEVNPKSDGGGHEPDFMSNYIRLPYPGGLGVERPEARAMYQVDLLLPVEDFVPWAFRERTAPDVFARAAALYVPPPEPKRIHVEPSVAPFDDDVLRRRLNGLAFTMLRDGPLSADQDRSGFLFKLAAQCRESDLSPTEAYIVVREADVRHTHKYVGRPDEEDRIRRTVERAYT